MSSPSVLRLHPDDDVAARALTVAGGGQVRKYRQVIGATM